MREEERKGQGASAALGGAPRLRSGRTDGDRAAPAAPTPSPDEPPLRHGDGAASPGSCFGSVAIPGDEARRLIPSPQGGGGLIDGSGRPDPEPLICPGNNRRMQVRRAPRRKLFGKRAKETFLESLACTGNVTASAEAAGVAVGTIYNHRRKDPEFRQAYWLALEQSVAKLVALRVQRELERAERAQRAADEAAGRPSTSLGTNGEGSLGTNGDALTVRLDGPPDERQIVDLIKLMAMLRDLCRNLAGPESGAAAGKPGAPRQAASAEEVVEALEKRLKAFRRRREAEAGQDSGAGRGEAGDAAAA